MGRAPCCDKANVKKGPWSPEEDARLKEYIEKNGTGGNWIALPQKAGLRRCGKSCRLRWLNYLRPNIKHGEFSDAEDRIICSLFASIGSRWSIIAAQLPGRTDNDIKNYWNTKLKKKLMGFVSSSQRHTKPYHHQSPAVSFSTLLQTSSSLSSSPPISPSPSTTAFSSSTSPNRCSNNSNTSYYYTPVRSLTNLELMSLTSSLFSQASCVTTSGSLLHQPQESLMGTTTTTPMHHYQVRDGNLLMFGGDQASCSSSDGSCNQQISHDKELEYSYGGGANTCYVYNNGIEEEQKFTAGHSHGGLLWGEQNPLDYSGLEEIKQLISSTISCSNNFLLDEIKTEEKVICTTYHDIV